MRIGSILLLSLAAACGSPATDTGASVEEGGSFAKSFPYARDAVFHASIAAAKDLGYTLEVADPMSGRISGRSEIKRRGLGAQVEYYLLRADIEAPQASIEGVRLRLVFTHTYHLSGQSRSSLNDKIVGSRKRYDEFFTAVQKELESK